MVLIYSEEAIRGKPGSAWSRIFAGNLVEILGADKSTLPKDVGGQGYQTSLHEKTLAL